MFIIVYGVLSDDGDDDKLLISGPFFHISESDFAEAEILARKLADQKTKNQIIPWVIELKENESVSDAMIRIEGGWFKKFKSRTMETHSTIQKDFVNSTCPFVDVEFDKCAKYLTEEMG